MSEHDFDVVVIGCGQAVLAMCYYLREQGLRFANMAGVFSPVRTGCAIAAPVTSSPCHNALIRRSDRMVRCPATTW